MVPVRRHVRGWRTCLACAGLAVAGLYARKRRRRPDDQVATEQTKKTRVDKIEQSCVTPGNDPATVSDNYCESRTSSQDRIGKRNSNETKSFISRLTISEWLTFLTGFGSLLVSGFTYINARNTSDIKHAVDNLSNLATETKRQADTAAQSLAEIHRDALGWLSVEAFQANGVSLSDDLGLSSYSVEVLFRNVGKMPSTRQAIIWNTNAVDLGRPITTNDRIVSNPSVTSRSACDATEPPWRINRSSKILFPNASGVAYTMNHETSKSKVQAIIDGHSIIFIQGCIVYNSGGESHKTWFCELTAPPEGADISKWQFESCHGDNNGAD